MKIPLTPPRIPWIDARTGMVSREWELFLRNLTGRVGDAESDITYVTTESYAVPAEQEEQVVVYQDGYDCSVDEYYDRHEIETRLEDIESMIASLPMAQEAATATIIPGGPSPGGGYSYFPNGW